MDKSEYDMLKIENQVCFLLYACARESMKKYTPFLEELDLTYTQYITMLVLWEKNSLKLKEVGKILYLDSGTLTPILKRLEEKGLVLRERNKNDARDLNVTLTEKGEGLKEKALAIQLCIKESHKYDVEKIKELKKILYAFLKEIKKG